VSVTSLGDAPNPPPVAKSRRSFLGVLLGLASTTVGVLLGIPVVRYLLYPLTSGSTASAWTAAGSLSEMTASPVPVSRTLHLKERDGWRETASNPTVFLIRKGDTVQALSAICPHLGCILPWDASRNAFVCPCHGGVFGPDGAYRSGPPRRGMDTLQTKVTNGNVMVKYQTFRPDVPNKQVTS
jgi:Rieske Fe-S protein